MTAHTEFTMHVNPKDVTYGWNSWDPVGVNRLMHPKLDVEVILATLDLKTGVVMDEYSYHVREERCAIAEGKKVTPEMELVTEQEREEHKRITSAGVSGKPMGWIGKAGGRNLDLSRGYLKLGHTLERGFWEADFACGSDQAAVRLSVDGNDPNLRFVIIVRAPWGRSGYSEASVADARIVARSGADCPKQEVVLRAQPEAALSADTHAALLDACAETMDAAESAGAVTALVLPFESFDLRISPEGRLCDPPHFAPRPEGNDVMAELRESVESVVGWNLCWDPVFNRLQLPVNKEWVAAGLHGISVQNCYFSDGQLEYAMGPAVFTWDSGFLSIMTAFLDPKWGQEVLKSAIAYNLKPDGGLSTCRMGLHQLDATTNPPTLTWAASRIYQKTGDKAFLDEVYPALRNWFYWVKRERDRNGDGLYEWGINPGFGSEWTILMAGRMESGLDNSPMYFDQPVSEGHHTMAMNCVDLSCFQALAAESLVEMARALGRDEEASALQEEREQLKRLINERLWDETRGIYANRLWSGEFGETITPTSFYALTSGVATQDRAKSVIKNWILNTEHFGVDYPVPSVDAADPHYNPDGNYWRGRIWGPMSYLTFAGLLRYDKDAARWLAEKSAEVFLPDWWESGRVYENYSARTGRGKALPETEEAVCNCDFYVWGGLLALMALELEKG